MATITHDYRELYKWDLEEQHTILDGIATAAERFGDHELLADLRPARAQVRRAIDLRDALAIWHRSPFERRQAPHSIARSTPA